MKGGYSDEENFGDDEYESSSSSSSSKSSEEDIYEKTLYDKLEDMDLFIRELASYLKFNRKDKLCKKLCKKYNHIVKKPTKTLQDLLDKTINVDNLIQSFIVNSDINEDLLEEYLNK